MVTRLHRLVPSLVPTLGCHIPILVVTIQHKKPTQKGQIPKLLWVLASYRSAIVYYLLGPALGPTCGAGLIRL
uniref:Uncharacterized protein n=1 Tax=Pararge aegeria TaxID=116150 RepID=S4P2X4_9NEOP